jgi:polyphosphate:AMP phosphotransferase
MFETAELGRTVSKKDFKKASATLREELLELQDALLRGGQFQVIVLFAGVDGAGKGETVSLLNEWMDPRWLVTRAYDVPTEEERERPEFWKYWRDLPPRGRMGMFLSAWYSQPVLERVHGEIDEAGFMRRLERIAGFERALARDGALILKFWMHLSHEGQEQRLKSLERDPLTRARVTKRDWDHWRKYDRFIAAAEQVIAYTNRGIAPWTVVEGTDPNYRSITVCTILRDALERRLRQADRTDPPTADTARKSKHRLDKAAKARKSGKPADGSRSGYCAAKAITILSQLDMTQRLPKATYDGALVELQARLHLLHLAAKARKTSSILVFEGPDAAGKGGAIRRVHEALDARNYQVHGIAAPTDEERAQHYLWRFWRHLPRGGYITIFDRSWYGRILVERVEGLASEDEWRRSYAEINEFEDQLIEHGVVLMKYWIHITEDEQLARFKAREKTPYKRWKLTAEDWRNRDRWNDYETAVDDMVQYTSTSASPWTLVEGNDKRFARVKVIRTYCDRLAAALGEATQA